MCDIVVVGGGPVGMRVAQRSAEAGYDTLVLEEHSSIGSPMQCAGLVSPRVVEMTGTKNVFMEASAATIHAPDGNELFLDAGEPQAALLDRKRFDREMAESAIKKGVELRLDCRVTSVRKNRDRPVVHYEKGGKKCETSPRIVVGADGPTSIVRRGGGMGKPKYMLASVQGLVGYKTEEIHIYLGNEVAPGFFLWEVPHPEGALVGLASEDGKVYELLKRHLSRKGWKNKSISLYSGSIPLGLLNNTVDNGLMLVGDAACQVKPLSGGGLYTGLLSADICGDTLIRALEREDTSKEFLYTYHEAWQKNIGVEISKGLWMRRIFKDLTDRQLNDLINILNNERVIKVIRERGDIDYPSALAGPVFKSAPKLLKFAGPIIKGLF
ncbi:MAG: NAD(P)/FAD-dependent oxidoreductase [Thermoplasmata archaeon]